MRYATAVNRLRTIAEDCDRHAKFWEEPVVVAAYVYGKLLEGPDELDVVEMALVVDLPADQVTWYAEPPAAAAFAEVIGLGKAPVVWWWRPTVWPVWNHEIRGPVRFWSLDGPDLRTLDALADRRFGEIRRLTPTPQEEMEQLQEELAACLTHLRQVTESYWERDWRREHSGFNLYPEHHLWRATQGYLELLTAIDRRRDEGRGQGGSGGALS